MSSSSDVNLVDMPVTTDSLSFKEQEWKSEHESILVEWADKAMCYRWLHAKYHQSYSKTNNNQENDSNDDSDYESDDESDYNEEFNPKYWSTILNLILFKKIEEEERNWVELMEM